MKKRLACFLLVQSMLLSCMTPALAVGLSGGADDGQVVQRGDLTEVDESIVIPGTGETTDTVSQIEAVGFLLRYAGMEDAQLGTYPGDYEAMADSLGMLPENYSADEPCTAEMFADMKDGEAITQLKAAMNAEKKEPLFLNGMAQPIFPYTTGAVEEGYSNEDSDIIRYCVYVETNYDTDDDGKLDLVKALVQLPRAAAEGDYSAATIYEARPYITGCTPFWGDKDVYGSEGYDIKKLYSQPAARTAAGESTTMEAAAKADSSDWYYWNEYEDMYDYEDLDWYDYYLVRGYAVVECGGLGTLGSDGFETCGTDLEIDAFKCVIEWLHGDRVAYTDKTSNVAIKADWSNGKVGMTGRSYAGTTQFGLATTGVAGLETVVPVAGIASWYEYTNSQGISTSRNAAYSDILALYCAGRYLDPTDWASISGKYGEYLYQLQQDQLELNGDYGDHWAVRDYTLDAENIKCPALIVHGLNDYNVRTKEFSLMYDAFKTAGQNVKLLLHQDGHLTPTYPSGKVAFNIGNDTYDEILNRWFSHYLYGVENGAENMPAVTAEDSHDPNVWNTYDSWETGVDQVLNGAAANTTTTVTSDYASAGITRSNWESAFTSGSSAQNAMYAATVDADTVVKGTVAVSFRATVNNVESEEAEAPRGDAKTVVDHDNTVNPNTLNSDALDHDNAVNPSYLSEDSGTVSTPGADLIDRDALMVSAMLVDIAPQGETFPAFNTVGSYVPKTTLEEGGAWMGGGLKNYDLAIHNTTDVSYKVISRGWMDLCNPGAGIASDTAAAKVKLKTGEYYDYTIYLQPTVYEVEEGHTLAVVIYPYEPSMKSYTQNYTITLNNASVTAKIPVDSKTEAAPLTINYVERSFADVPDTEYYCNAVEWAVKNEITAGTSATTFGPNDTCTRAQIVQLLYNQAKKPAVELTGRFSDVAADAWYAKAVAWALEQTITAGTSDTTFSPDASCTRAHVVQFLYNAAGKPEVTKTDKFTDVSSDAWYSDAVAWAVENKITVGTSDTTFAPEKTCTRAEIVQLLYNQALKAE